MKKILLASTAIVGFAGAASAELALTGGANMGVKYQENMVEEFTTHYEIDFNIVGSGETDNGLTFGASVDLDIDNGASTFGDGEVFISGSFGTLTIGAVDAADDQFFGALEVGFDGIGLDDVAENGYGGGSHNVLYTYSAGGLSFALSFGASNNFGAASDDFAIGVQYDADVVTVALGYNEQDGGPDITTLEVSGSAGDIGYTVVLTDHSVTGDSYGIGLTYASGAMTLSGGIADSDSSTDPSIGIGVAYDLGGGATLAGAIGSINDETRMDFGITMSF